MMEYEINSQTVIIEELIKKYVVNYCVLLDLPPEIRKVSIIASGSSYNAGIYGKFFFENIANLETSTNFASEFCYNKLISFDFSTLYIFISQSGESKDTLLAMNKVKAAGAKTLCITNNSDSTMYKNADFKVDVQAGQEKAIAATKTFSASVAMLYLYALKAAQNRRIDITKEIENISQTRAAIEATLKNVDNLDYAAKLISKQNEFSIAGWGINFALSREAALKIKETSYINTSSYPLGEFVHGHFALLNKSKLFLGFMLGEVSDFEKQWMKKIIKTYKPKTIIISDKYEDYDSDILVKFPECNSNLALILSSIIVVQMLSLKVALKLKRNVDKPTGLNKVVNN